MSSSVFLHMVYFYPKQDAGAEDTKRLIAGIHKHLPGIPGVLRLETGTPAGTPRDVVDNSYAVALLVEFADAAGHDVYADHPDHLRFIEECSPFWSDVKVYDSLVTRGLMPVRRVWALADTHLGAAVGKTMDRFGNYWIGHKEKILKNTWRVVAQEDVLLLPGDLSWAMNRQDAIPDLSFLAALPGIKIAIKGNHDYWWESGRRIDYPGLLSPPQILDDGALGIAGTRGWYVPVAGGDAEADDRRVLERERERLRRSLQAIASCETKIVMTHYPPQPFLLEIAEAGAAAVVYGHVHLGSLPEDEVLALDGDIIDGVPLYCVACDRIDFTPRRIL